MVPLLHLGLSMSPWGLSASGVMMTTESSRPEERRGPLRFPISVWNGQERSRPLCNLTPRCPRSKPKQLSGSSSAEHWMESPVFSPCPSRSSPTFPRLWRPTCGTASFPPSTTSWRNACWRKHCVCGRGGVFSHVSVAQAFPDTAAPPLPLYPERSEKHSCLLEDRPSCHCIIKGFKHLSVPRCPCAAICV